MKKSLLIILLSLLTSYSFCQDFSDYDSRVKNILDNNLQDYQYLIVTPNNSGIQQWADTLAKFRNEQGISTKVMSLSDIGDNIPLTLRNYFKEFYNSRQLSETLSAILLFGDYNLDDTSCEIGRASCRERV